MEACFPTANKGQLVDWQRSFYSYLSRFIAELFKAFQADDAFFEERVEASPEVIDTINQYIAKGRNIVLLTGHYGNWEWAAARLSAIGGINKYILYRPQSALADTWISLLRKKSQAILLPENKVREVYRAAIGSLSCW